MNMNDSAEYKHGFKLGLEAFRRGGLYIANPYNHMEGDAYYDGWRDGWRAAAGESPELCDVCGDPMKHLHDETDSINGFLEWLESKRDEIGKQMDGIYQHGIPAPYEEAVYETLGLVINQYRLVFRMQENDSDDPIPF